MNSPLKRAGALLGILAIAAAAVFGVAISAPSASLGAEGTPHLMLTLKDGVVDIELLPDLAPKHVERIVTLTEKGFYDGIVFHRVIEGFMAQTGDPTGTGGGGSDLPDVVAEFNSTHYDRGIVGAARTNDPDTFNSQFFITLADAGFLDGQYTVFGKVVSGMEFVDNIKKGDPQSGLMDNPDKIVSAKIEYR
ncbi:MAG: peptidylprolyl isomerase [Devosia nanyangense]|uniref:Peptidyl-prolyl cis-trans isomerase n=1 Tax=Devosia nanyangense TaxID=1228055 RepID=A0A933NZH2_9HYPH|nr:peptidylprolyl isomerase [Devosia nanyangense]